MSILVNPTLLEYMLAQIEDESLAQMVRPFRYLQDDI